MRSYITTILSTLSIITPTLVFGANVTAPRDFKGFIAIITDIIGTLIILVFALTAIVFIWGIIKAWIIGGDNVESVDEGKKVAITGIIVLVIMVSIWGILALLKNSIFGR